MSGPAAAVLLALLSVCGFLVGAREVGLFLLLAVVLVSAAVAWDDRRVRDARRRNGR